MPFLPHISILTTQYMYVRVECIKCVKYHVFHLSSIFSKCEKKTFSYTPYTHVTCIRAGPKCESEEREKGAVMTLAVVATTST